MNPAIEVETNALAMAQVMGGLAKEQFPYATAQALTTLAFMAQKDEKSEIAHEFTLRNRFSQSGIQVNRAEKGDWPNQQSEVGIEQKRSYLIDHVTGANRPGGSHGRAILAEESLRQPNGRIARKNKPGTMIKGAAGNRLGRPKGAVTGQHKAPLPFVIATTSKWGNEVLVRRQGDARYPLQILYAFKQGVHIKREFEMDVVAAKAVQGQYQQVFAKALGRALATAKPKAERSASRSAGGTIDSGR